MSFTISGIDSAKAKILKVQSNVKDGSEEALDKGAEACLAQARINCPRSNKTGEKYVHLQDELHIDSHEEGHRYVGSNKFYSEFVHEGTTRMSARPFLLNAGEETKADFINAAKSIKVL